MTKTLILKNKYLSFLANHLAEFNIAGNDSRQRSRFIKLLEERLIEIEKERIKMLNKYANKDKENKPIMIKSQRKNEENVIETTEEYDITLENMVKYQDEFNKYMDEDLIIDILEGNKSKIQKTTELLLKSTISVNKVDATLYDEICEIFEKLTFKK